MAFVGCCSTEKVGPDYLYNTSTPEQNARTSASTSRPLIASDSGAKANTLYVDIPAFTILASLGTSLKQDYATYCPGCDYAKIDVPLPRLADSPQHHRLVPAQPSEGQLRRALGDRRARHGPARPR